MRKRILETNTADIPPDAPVWLDLERLARVELSSEEPAHPVEAVLISGDTRGWRAAHSGEQTIRLLFDEPLNLRHIRLVITETEHERTQEFVLRWWWDGGRIGRLCVSNITSARRRRRGSVKTTVSNSRASGHSSCTLFRT